MVPIWKIRPAPENDQIYRPIDRTDPEFLKLAASVVRFGILQPPEIDRDNNLITGHRRVAAGEVAGLEEIPCLRRLDVSRDDDLDGFLARVIATNESQRQKSRDELLRESCIALSDDVDAHEELLQFRRKSSRVEVKALKLGAIEAGKP
jgi:ParB-like chromosome segregation protein Spo0J